MRYEIFIGFRYLRARSKQFFISFISIISVLGVAVGVATVIVALSVMSGFESMIRDKMLKSEGHIIIFGDGDRAFGDYQYLMKKIESVDGVVATAPALVRQAYLQDAKGDNQMGVLIKGIKPDLESKVTGIGEYVHGKLDFDSPLIKIAQSMTNDNIFGGIILGKGVARRLEVSEGDIIRLISRLVETPGGLIPMIRTLVVVGIYDSGMYTYDSSLAFLSLYDAQELYETGDGVDRIEVKIDNIYHADRIRRDIQMEIGLNYFTMTWMEAHKDLFSAINLEKIVTFIIEALIILVAAFNITSTLIMLVMDKTKEIGILKSMGATKRSVWTIFVFEGTFIGVIGSILGTLLGIFLCWSLETWLPIRIPGTVYQVDRLPAEINWNFVLFVNVCSLLICWLATLYPAWRASTLRPVEALRYE
ncbi:MAG: FtsX-like permease family protein [Candidatus Poribacteria bacterium]